MTKEKQRLEWLTCIDSGDTAFMIGKDYEILRILAGERRLLYGVVDEYGLYHKVCMEGDRWEFAPKFVTVSPSHHNIIIPRIQDEVLSSTGESVSADTIGIILYEAWLHSL